MGADGHIDVSDPKEIEKYLIKVVSDAIIKYVKQTQNIEYNSYNVIFTEYDLIITFYYNDEDIPEILDINLSEDELITFFENEIIIKTIEMESGCYWGILETLIDNFNWSLDKNDIPKHAWENFLDEYDENEESFRKELKNIIGMNYTYSDNLGFYDDDYTIADYFMYGSEKALQEIYSNIFLYIKYNDDIYKTFDNIFPSLYEFEEILEKYKDMVSIRRIEMWT